MSATLTPRTVEPGWLKRWTAQSWALWRRNPLLLAVNLIALPAIMMLVPNMLGVGMLVSIPLSALIFIECRMLDQAGPGSLRALWDLFHGSLKDIVFLTRDIFVFLFFVTMLAAILAHMISSIGGHTHALPPDAMDSFTRIMNPWIADSLLSMTSWAELVIGPLAGPILYLTLLVGHQLMMHLQTSVRGMFKNLGVAFTLLGINVSTMWIPGTVGLLFRPYLGASMAGFLVLLLLDVFLLYSMSCLYLWGREMFEGQKENAPETARQTAGQLIHSSI